jgi:hypothetical protein
MSTTQEQLSRFRHLLLRYQVPWLTMALVIGVAIRGYYLAQPMRYDEAYTFLNFADTYFSRVFFYPLPNNHVFHTLLVKLSTLIWSPHPVTIRLPAFVAGIGLIPLTFYLCRYLKISGILATIGVAVCPYLVLYSTNARGFTILMFLTVLMILIGIQIAEDITLRKITLFAIAASFGMFTMPSMMMAISGILFWLTCLLVIRGNSIRESLVNFLIPCSLLIVLITTLLYIPVIIVSDGIESIVANDFVKSQPIHEFVSQVLPHLQQVYIYFTRDIPKAALLALFVLSVIGILASIKNRDWKLLLLLPGVLLGSALVFGLRHRIPFVRTWIYTIPLFLILADAGFSALLNVASDKIQFLMKQIVLIFGIVMAVSLTSKNVIAHYPDTGVFPEAPIAAQFLQSHLIAHDLVTVPFPLDWSLYFYLWYYDAPKYNTQEDSRARNEFIVVKNEEPPSGVDSSAQKVFSFRDIEIYQTVRNRDLSSNIKGVA